MPRRVTLGFPKAVSALALILALTPGSGCSMLQTRQTPMPPTLPEARPVAASEVIERINKNAQLIDSLRADPSITVFTPNDRAHVDGKMAFQRDRNFRLTLKSSLAKEADLGSNSQGFWFWLKRSDTKEAIACSYDAAGNSPLQATFQPDWIIEALGLRVIPESEIADSLVEPGTGRFADSHILTQRRVTNLGEVFYKQTIVNKETGLIQEHKLLGSDKKTLLAQAIVERYQSVPLVETAAADNGGDNPTVVLPDKFRLFWVQEQLELQIQLGRPKLNPNIELTLFDEPAFPGYTRVDLATRANAAAAAAQGQTSVPSVSTDNSGPGVLTRETGEPPTNLANMKKIPLGQPQPLRDDPIAKALNTTIEVNPDNSSANRLADQVLGAQYPRGPGAIAPQTPN